MPYAPPVANRHISLDARVENRRYRTAPGHTGRRARLRAVDLDYYYSSVPNLIVNISASSERLALKLYHVSWLSSCRIFYRLANDPSALVNKNRTIMNVSA